ncbi:MAG TPA: lectin-like protein [Phycisphaerales bacterium]|nr:lectin-like protein [Phycisphaerales bacterium]
MNRMNLCAAVLGLQSLGTWGAWGVGATVLLWGEDARGQTVVRGPVYRSQTQTRYYLIEAPNWNAAAFKAGAMGGELAKIDDAGENEWIRTNLFTTGTKAFIGLNDAAQEGVLEWSGGGESAYRNWNGGNSGNSGSSDYAYMESTGGTWLMAGATYTPYAIVEVTGPIRLPGEFASFSEAGPFMGVLSQEVQILPGETPMGNSAVITIPPGKKVTVQGYGAEHSSIKSRISGETLTLRGAWEFRDLAIVGTDGGRPLLQLGDGASEFEGVELTKTGTLVGPAISVLSGASTTWRRSRLHDLWTAPVIFQQGSLPSRFENCLFSNIDYYVMFMFYGTDVTLSSCTVTGTPDVGISAFNANGGGTLNIENSILWGLPQDLFHHALTVNVRYSNVQSAQAGEGNISLPPEFVSGYRLGASSPCIDAGSTRIYEGSLFDLAGGLRLIDDPAMYNAGIGGIDMGCFEAPSGGCHADFDGSGFVDLDDFAAFVAAFESGC